MASRKRGAAFVRSETWRSNATVTSIATGTVSGKTPAEASIGVGSCRGSHAQASRTSALRSTRAPPALKPPTVNRTRPRVSSREAEMSCSGFSTR